MIQKLSTKPPGTHEWLVERLREEFILGELSQEDPLRQDDLAKKYSVSRIPLREALRTLAAEGWIDVVPNRGTYLVPLTADDAIQLFHARAAIEIVASRYSLGRMTSLEHEALKTSYECLRDATKETYFSAHRAFHLALHAGASARLQRLIALQIDACERYLRLESSQLDVQHEDQREHALLLQAALNRDAKVVTKLLGQHIAQGGESIARYIQSTNAPASL